MKTQSRKQRSSLGLIRQRMMGPAGARISENPLDCLRDGASPGDDELGVGGEQR